MKLVLLVVAGLVAPETVSIPRRAARAPATGARSGEREGHLDARVRAGVARLGAALVEAPPGRKRVTALLEGSGEESRRCRRLVRVPAARVQGRGAQAVR